MTDGVTIPGAFQGAFPERRKSDAPALLMLVQQIHDNVQALDGRMGALDGRLTVHMTDETLELAEAVADLMQKAFLDGDAAAHRAEHELSRKRMEQELERLKARREFWQKLTFELAKYGLLGFIGWLVITLWNAFLQGPHK